MKEIIFDLLGVGRQAKVGLTPEVGFIIQCNKRNKIMIAYARRH